MSFPVPPARVAGGHRNAGQARGSSGGPEEDDEYLSDHMGESNFDGGFSEFLFSAGVCPQQSPYLTHMAKRSHPNCARAAPAASPPRCRTGIADSLP